MQISKVNGQFNFGKRLIANCQIVDKNSKEKQSASIYELNTRDVRDREFIENNDWFPSTVVGFFRDYDKYRNYRTYNAVVNNQTGEMVGISAATNHYKCNSVNIPGATVCIDSISLKNGDGDNVEEILVAKSVNDAFRKHYKSVTASTSALDRAKLKKASFSETKNGDWVMPERRMEASIKRAQKQCAIEFLV